MFDLGIWEILVILVVALLVLKPEDIPGMMRSAGRMFGKLKRLSEEFSDALQLGLRENGLHDITPEMKKVTGDDGTVYEAYDVDEVRKKKE